MNILSLKGVSFVDTNVSGEPPMYMFESRTESKNGERENVYNLNKTNRSRNAEGRWPAHSGPAHASAWSGASMLCK